MDGKAKLDKEVGSVFMAGKGNNSFFFPVHIQLLLSISHRKMLKIAFILKCL